MEEGADILMVKPAGPYLDVLADVAKLGLPVAGYQVSGEYSMIKAAAERGWIKEKETVLRSLPVSNVPVQTSLSPILRTMPAGGWNEKPGAV